MKLYLPTFFTVALCPSLFLSLWATIPFPARAATVKTITVEKSVSAKTGEEGTKAEDDKPSSEPRVIIKSIELPEGEDGQRKDLPWLGVSVNEAGEALTAQLGLAPGVGLVVTYVAPDSPAAEAGLRKHDVLVAFQDQSLVLPAQLRKLVQARKEGDSVKLKFYHAGNARTVSATLAARPPGLLVADGEDGLSRNGDGPSRELHLRLLGAPSAKELELQMESLKGLLGNLKIDSKKIQEEVLRSVEKARKSYQDALRQWDKSTSTSDASRQALEDLAHSGVLLDNKATVTVRSNDKSCMSLVKTDDSGTIVIVANPKLHLTAHDRDGKLLFDGAIETEEQRAKVPKEVWEKAEPMVSQLKAKPEE